MRILQVGVFLVLALQLGAVFWQQHRLAELELELTKTHSAAVDAHNMAGKALDACRPELALPR